MTVCHRRSPSESIIRWIAFVSSSTLAVIHAGACGGVNALESEAGPDASVSPGQDATVTPSSDGGAADRNSSDASDANHRVDAESGTMDATVADAGSDALADSSDALADVSDTGTDAPLDSPPDAACIVCGALCVDLTTSSSNCGYCGHDCQGGSCKAGACQPVPLVYYVYDPGGIAVDSDTIFYTEYGKHTVWGLPKAGGPLWALATGQAGPVGITVDGTNAYWTNGVQDAGNIVSMPLNPPDGGSPFVIASGQDYPWWGIAVDSTNVYWTTVGVSGHTGTVMSAPLDGGPPTTLATGQQSTYTLAIDGAHVYWTQASPPDGSVMEVAKAGGVPSVLVTSPYPLSLAVDSTSLYWMDWTTNSLMALNLGSSSSTLLASSVDSEAYLTQDDLNVYVAGINHVTMVPKSGGTATILASYPDVASAVAIAVDATTVYWANNGGVMGGSIEKVAKP